MKIAQVAPLYESVPPPGYGGTERVVSWLTEELVRLGHKVTLFASGDSRTKAKLIAGSARALRTSLDCRDYLAHHVLMLEQLGRCRDEFDIVHFHTDYLHFSLCRQWRLNHLTTLHGRLDLPDLVPLYREFNDVPVVSISRGQRRRLPEANWIGNVYHGLPEHLLRFHRAPGTYLAFLGRISPEKRPDRAIAIARAAGVPLKIAAKVDRSDRGYFEQQIRPLLAQPGIDFIGEIGDGQKSEFLGNAMACLAPIDWPEPFGLNMIEAMACGTPTIAFRHGSVPEVIDNGVSGIIVESVEEAVLAVERIKSMSRAACRNAFERRFTARRMAQDYLRLYERLIEEQKKFHEIPIEVRSASGEDPLVEDAV
ncbi:MAG: glycosyltransferase family 4 protein [Acidobacteriia bacterium]|nr:glycosyltransferase family 4 protein [Terriglobia bacterium]